MATIQIVSDLHLEATNAYNTIEIPPKAPYLALLGDIGNTEQAEPFTSFLDRQLRQFQVVLLVPGNHEPYRSTWEESKAFFRRYEDDVRQRRAVGEAIGSFVLLDRTRHDIPGTTVTILGCTLFSSVPAAKAPAVQTLLNDFKYIRDWAVEDHDRAHQADLDWLNAQVESLADGAEPGQPGRTIAVLTHHSPTADKRASNPRHENTPIHPAFVTDLARQPCWTARAVVLWAFGHTHFNCDFRDWRTGKRVYANQRGYFADVPGWDVGRVVEIPGQVPRCAGRLLGLTDGCVVN
ncbi:Metallo-dependent phosphatase-like protein [Phialemonium atrogriseum]|uniref:Metallo-dependent phosphatase-like protein n=1 Tax=Phialemonium atrogriseum TaxID=1093897 RepID=A0AAJ0BYB8_9PEZI|nr:Metallo-dependent phosphatase-like protein [Phialemonium atrogriseum]KAK1765663.1 Metallo-dependent phosphatase-like protein [Phialemonium atrogriseum]